MWYKILVIGMLLGFLPAAQAEQSTQATNTPDRFKYYNDALACYSAKDYDQAYRLFGEAMSLLSDQKEIIPATFYQACSNFYRRSLIKLKTHYEDSARAFESFYHTYPNAAQAEEALYMQSYALYLASPDVEKDQALTKEAIQTFQAYIDHYPTGIYRQQALQYQAQLYDKLAHKAFNNAKLYYKLSHYQAAIIALTAFQKDFPGTSLCEEAAYLKIDAQYKLVQQRPQEDHKNRLKTLLTYCCSFLDLYPASHYTQVVGQIYEKAIAQSN